MSKGVSRKGFIGRIGAGVLGLFGATASAGLAQKTTSLGRDPHELPDAGPGPDAGIGQQVQMDAPPVDLHVGPPSGHSRFVFEDGEYVDTRGRFTVRDVVKHRVGAPKSKDPRVRIDPVGRSRDALRHHERSQREWRIRGGMFKDG